MPLNDQRVEIAGVDADGYLLWAIGNYTDNIGPCDIAGYRPDDDASVVHLASTPTEELWTIRTDYQGWSWTANVDPVYPPRGAADGTITTNEGGDWRVITVTPPAGINVLPVHIFDIAPPTATDPSVYLCGVRDVMVGEGPNQDGETAAVAFVWRAANLAAAEAGVWAEVVHDQSNVDGFHRFYGFGRVGDTLCIGAHTAGRAATGDGPHTIGWWHGTGASWTRHEGPLLQSVINRPPVWGENTFAVDGAVYEWDGASLKILNAYLGFSRPLIHEGDDAYLYVSNTGVLRHSSTGFLGQLPNPTPQAWRAARSGGELYLSDMVHLWHYEP